MALKHQRSNGIFLLFLLTLYFSITNCNNNAKTTPPENGEQLAKKHCNTCHKYPEPSLIDRESWEKHVLPAMALQLGIKVYSEDMYVNDPRAKSTVTYDEWTKIVAFYKSMAPIELKPVKNNKADTNFSFFKLIKAPIKLPVATTMLVSFDTISKQIYTSDMLNKTLYQWSDGLKLNNSMVFNSAVVDTKFNRNDKGIEEGEFTFIGSLDAVDNNSGLLMGVDLSDIKNKEKYKTIGKGLNRPVQSASGDFNKDGLIDWVVCEFGHKRGGLSLFTQAVNGTYNKSIIRDITGATNITVGDFNNDGWPDIMCLFAQGDEGIWLFINDHKGGFETQNLLRFPPVYGSNSFQLVDFNNDGKLDILYTCGDNSDYSRILKPYHGVYIFINKGNFKYEQSYFYHINGATKAIAADFNGDNKLDIAVIAFFSDLRDNPAEGFTYLEQTDYMKFRANNIPIANQGRWICMDVKDYNGDGKPDIILGNFSIGFINDPGVKKNWDIKNPFIILQNNHTK